MKRFLMMAFVAMGLATMVGCTKDNSELILGTWVSTADSFEQYTLNGETEIEHYPDALATITFNADGSMVITAQVLDDKGNFETWFDTYTVNDDKLIWDGETFTILQLDKKKLVFEMTETETWEEDGETINAQYIMHFDFNRENRPV